MRGSLIVGIFTGLGLLHLNFNDEASQTEAKLWAAVSVSCPVFEEDQVKDALHLTFALVNDGKKVIAPDLKSSTLLINGKELTTWSHQILQGPQNVNTEQIPPGDYWGVTLACGERFTKPGTYKIIWKGKHFQANELTFRVLPKKE